MTPNDVLLLMLTAWVRDVESVPFPTIEAPEAQR